MKIAVIGAGYAGVTVTGKLVKHGAQEPLAIDLYDREAVFGTGVAYQQDKKTNLLNRPIKNMYIENHGDFQAWLNSVNTEESTNNGDDFLPRDVFGQFLQFQLTQIKQEAEAGGNSVSLINQEVDGLKRSSCKTRFILSTKLGDTSYDKVYLCLGNNLSSDPYDLIETDNYVSCPYPVSTLSKLNGLRVGILGCRLTAYDVALSIESDSIVMASRESDLPRTVKRYQKIELKYLTKESIDAIDTGSNSLGFIKLLNLFEKEFQYHGVSISFSRVLAGEQSDDDDLVSSILLSTNMITPYIWQRLPEQSKDTFMRHFHRLWSNMRVPIANKNAERIAALKESGSLTHKKHLTDVTYTGSTYLMHFKDAAAGSNGSHVVEVDAIVNATGIQREIDKRSVLMAKLLEQNVAEKDPHGGIKVSADDCCVIDGNGDRVENLFALGQLTCGAFYMVNNIDAINHQADISSLPKDRMIRSLA